MANNTFDIFPSRLSQPRYLIVIKISLSRGALFMKKKEEEKTDKDEDRAEDHVSLAGYIKRNVVLRN